jgi:hypothetical protein
MIMIYLLVSLMAAFAMSFTAYSVTGSILLTLIAYSGTGVLVLMSVFLAAWLRERDDEREQNRQSLYPAE